MFSDNHSTMIKGISTLREWCHKNLPTENSLIAYDLILFLAGHDYEKKPITVKNLFASLPHSYTAVRGHYQRFVSEGWIEHYNDGVDRRIKYVRPTAPFVRLINEFTKTTTKIFEGMG